MKLDPSIVTIKPKILVGLSEETSLVNNKTGKLWQTFMPRRHEIQHRLGKDLYSVQVYSTDYFSAFNPDLVFTKWAAAEVSIEASLPKGMKLIRLAGGTYAVFHYGGLAGDPAIFHYIFEDWLLQSEYLLDDRPHFEILGENFRKNDSVSEEEIWIPVIRRT